jgi:hypothetical protein
MNPYIMMHGNTKIKNSSYSYGNTRTPQFAHCKPLKNCAFFRIVPIQQNVQITWILRHKAEPSSPETGHTTTIRLLYSHSILNTTLLWSFGGGGRWLDRTNWLTAAEWLDVTLFTKTPRLSNTLVTHRLFAGSFALTVITLTIIHNQNRWLTSWIPTALANKSSLHCHKRVRFM